MLSKPDETWDPAWGAGNSEFQTAAKDLFVRRARPFAALRACPRAQRRGDRHYLQLSMHAIVSLISYYHICYTSNIY